MRRIQEIGREGGRCSMSASLLSWLVRNQFSLRTITRALISSIVVLSPLASSMFTPGIGEIASDLGTSSDVVVGATTGFVVFLGLGPLILAPLSETFGRRILYLVCFSIFALLQIPTALSPNVGSLIAVRTISGFFGSMCSLYLLFHSRDRHFP